MTNKRKVSDAILNMESKVDNIVSLAKNTDNTIKILLGRINDLSKLLEPQLQQRRQQQQQFRENATNKSTYIPADNGIIVAAPMTEELVEYDEFGHPELSVEVLPKGQRRTSRAQMGDGDTGKRVSVSQQILSEDGKPVFLANVEILKHNPNPKRGDPIETLVKQTRTNPKGRWIAPLEPGEYIVHVVKRQSADGSKLPVELRYNVSIPNSDSPLELPSPQV